ncbi:UTRA domain-containing protein [Nonomuraea rubra]|uniref:UTRA domain-containing protein n=1 Tax=Nonomuraea rubra TaxID=46180 RepID=UPI00361D593E
MLPTEPAVRGSASLFLSEAQRQGLKAGRRMLYVGLEAASEQVAACLRVEVGADVVARRKMMTANDVPVRIATSYFRADLFGGTRLGEPGFVRPSLQAAIVDLGHAFGRAEESLIARPPTGFERETLELDPGSGSFRCCGRAIPLRTPLFTSSRRSAPRAGTSSPSHRSRVTTSSEVRP